MASSSPQRFVPLQECINFRDLGGYATGDGRRVRWNRLFRSDAIHFMTADDAEYVQKKLGIVTVLDLRNPEELEGQSRGMMDEPWLRYHNLPFLGGRKIIPPSPGEDPVVRLTGIYQEILQKAGNQIAEALTTLADSENLPAVFHCTAGKDRAGVLAALVLGVLGVDDHQIMSDYLLTNQIIDRLGQRLRARPGNEKRSLDSFKAWPQAMEQVLSEVGSGYGDAAGYARAHGVSDATIGRLKLCLLE